MAPRITRIFALYSPSRYTVCDMDRWCTVTVTVMAASTHDAAHLYLTHARNHSGSGLPPLTPASVFEVVIDGKVHRVEGSALQRWICAPGRIEGPKGHPFRLRPILD